jgi:hypothetical protein
MVRSIRDCIIKEGTWMQNIQVDTIRNAGPWALAAITYYDDNNDATRGYSALLKKSGAEGKLMQFSGQTMTTDILKRNKVPAYYWADLIDGSLISKTKPVLTFLHSKYPGDTFESVEISGDYALASWYGGEASGMTLLRRSGKKWKVLLNEGGVIDRSEMRKYSIPEQHIKSLMGIR